MTPALLPEARAAVTLRGMKRPAIARHTSPSRRRLLAGGALFACLALSHAGCSSSDSGTPAGQSAATPEVKAATPAVPAPSSRTPEDDEAYAPGEVGVCEIKRLPAARILEASGAGPAQEQATMNRAFGPLFNYIRKHDIPMTTPVEMRREGASVMAFHLGADSAARSDLAAEGAVTLRELPERLVASLTVRGSYTPERLAETEATLREWLALHPDWEIAGEAYAVYWNSPFMPGFLKRSEVHIPVRERRAR